MELILQFVSTYGNGGIVLLGVAVFILLIWNGIELSNQKGKLKDELQGSSVYKFNAETENILEEEDKDVAITPDRIRKYETKFNKTCSWHNVIVQMIPVFPLLGILGTVAGLMLQAQAGDVAGMMASLNVALETTFLGLIAAIGLKIAEAVFPSRVIYEVEVMLDDFDKKMSIAEMFQNMKEEK